MQWHRPENNKTEKEIANIKDLLEGTIDNITKKVRKIEEENKEQRSENKNIIYAVLIATVLIFAGLALEIMIFHTRDQSIGNEYRQKIDAIEAQITTSQNER